MNPTTIPANDIPSYTPLTQSSIQNDSKVNVDVVLSTVEHEITTDNLAFSIRLETDTSIRILYRNAMHIISLDTKIRNNLLFSKTITGLLPPQLSSFTWAQLVESACSRNARPKLSKHMSLQSPKISFFNRRKSLDNILLLPSLSVSRLAKILEQYLVGILNNPIFSTLNEVHYFTILRDNKTNQGSYLPSDIFKSKIMSKRVSLESYELVRVLGKGCMGKVLLVKEKETKTLFALKVVSKEYLFSLKEVEHTRSERNILANLTSLSHPFLMKMHHSFQTETELCMVLDYHYGGDIATQLAKLQVLDENRIRFYAAEIVIGIEELHHRGIIYRDLKPENILISEDGHIILTDFGLSKKLEDNLDPSMVESQEWTRTFCGTAEYLAPEILKSENYSYPVDWWSLGTLMYEMWAGITPFWAEDHIVMYRRMLHDELEIPANMDETTADLIKGLLERDPQKRFSVHEIKAHPFFISKINWTNVYNKKLTPPYIPKYHLSDPYDLSNFDSYFLDMSPTTRCTPVNEKVELRNVKGNKNQKGHRGINRAQFYFPGFSYHEPIQLNDLPQDIPEELNYLEDNNRLPSLLEEVKKVRNGSNVTSFTFDSVGESLSHIMEYTPISKIAKNTFPKQNVPLGKDPSSRMDIVPVNPSNKPTFESRSFKELDPVVPLQSNRDKENALYRNCKLGPSIYHTLEEAHHFLCKKGGGSSRLGTVAEKK